MKATGIVRRIDDLGRVVIPKEIRRTMRIREGDPLEIYTDREGEVIFKKYSPVGELVSFASQYAETLNKTCNMAVVITDRDTVIACAGISKREFSDRKLSKEFEEIMENRSFYNAENCANGNSVNVIDGNGTAIRCAMPIIVEGDVAGAVASLSVIENTGEKSVEEKLIKTAAMFLAKQLEA